MKKTDEVRNDFTEQVINEKICEAWNALDVSVLEPYLADDLCYDTFYWQKPLRGKNAVMQYLKRKFEDWSPGEDAMHAAVEEENGVMRPVLRSKEYAPSVYEVALEKGMITELLIRPAYFRFKFENLDGEFPDLMDIASDYLQNYFTNCVKKPWGWLQDYPTQVRFQDLCIAYDQYVLCICVGVVKKTLEYGQQILANQQVVNAMLGECEKYGMTPCLFLLDSMGDALFRSGCNLVDARTYEPIDLEKLKDDNGGKMSDWEVHNLGVYLVRQFLSEQGYTEIDYCDVIGISPQIFFKDHGQPCFAYVRSVPNGVADDEKYYIKAERLNRLTEGGLKGYFIDVRWSWIRGGSGLGNEKFLIRGFQLQQPQHGNRMNVMSNKPELTEIQKAIEEFPFIEVVDEKQER